MRGIIGATGNSRKGRCDALSYSFVFRYRVAMAGLEYKPDWEESRQRWTAWWRGEKLDRALELLSSRGLCIDTRCDSEVQARELIEVVGRLSVDRG